MITTAGWDSVYALNLSQMNAEIAKAVASGQLKLPHLQWTSTDSENPGGIDVPVTGLELINDSTLSGSNVSVKISTGAGTLTAMGEQTATLPGHVLGTLELARIDQPHLARIAITAPDAFKVSNADVPGLDSITSTFYATFIANAFSALGTAFQPVLAQVDLASPLRKTGSWLAPVAVGHCVAAGTNDGYVAILAMHPPFQPSNPLPPAIFDPGMMPNGSSAGLLFSPAQFTRHILFAGLALGLFYTPAIQQAAPNLTLPMLLDAVEKDHLQITGDPDHQIISMKPGSDNIPFKSIQIDGSVLYAVFAEAILVPVALPWAVLTLLSTVVAECISNGRPNLMLPVDIAISALNVGQEQGKLKVDMSVHCQVNVRSLQIATVDMHLTSTYELVSTPDGTFQFVPSGTPSKSDPQISTPDWLGTSQAVTQVITAIVGFAATVLTDGDAAVLIGISLGLISASMNMLPTLIADSTGSGVGLNAPAAITDFVAQAISPISWLGEAPFKPTEIELDGGIMFCTSPPVALNGRP